MGEHGRDRYHAQVKIAVAASRSRQIPNDHGDPRPWVHRVVPYWDKRLDGKQA